MAEAKKPWTWRARIAAMPPIDWEALAIEERDASRRTRKGDKRPLADVMAGLAARERNRKARQRAALERAVAAYKAPAYRHRQFNSVFTVAHRLALAMAPGGWYGRGDLRKLTGLRWGSIKARVGTMRHAGLLERTRNPGYREQRMLPGEGVHMIAPERRNPPLWLYRLTEAGLRLRREAEFLA